MNSFGEYLRSRREKLGLPLRKVAAELDIDTSMLSKIERSERAAIKEMLPTLAKTLEIQDKEIQIEFIQSTVLSELGDLEFLAFALLASYSSSVGNGLAISLYIPSSRLKWIGRGGRYDFATGLRLSKYSIPFL